MTMRGVCRRVLKLPPALGRFSGEMGYCRQPDSGNPTVRDERGAGQKRELWRTGNPPHISKECESETLALRLRALPFYPTERPTRLRSNRCGHAKRVQVLSCQLSGFGHVAMPVPVSGNGAGSARCIRPGGRGIPWSEQPEGQASMGA